MSVIDRIEAILESAKIDHVWAAARFDWSRRFAHLPWVPLARDSQRQGLVVIEETLVPAAEFADRFARHEEPCTTARIRMSGATIAKRLKS